jgi:myosin-crossreactive antigen
VVVCLVVDLLLGPYAWIWEWFLLFGTLFVNSFFGKHYWLLWFDSYFVLWYSACVCFWGLTFLRWCVIMRMILTFLNPFMQAITTSSTNKGEILVGDINTQLKHKNVTTDIKVDTDSNVSSVFLYLGFLFLLFF